MVDDFSVIHIGRFKMILEDWTGAEIYDIEPPLEDFVYFPFYGRA